jgi:hypothetical protein
MYLIFKHVTVYRWPHKCLLLKTRHEVPTVGTFLFRAAITLHPSLDIGNKLKLSKNIAIQSNYCLPSFTSIVAKTHTTAFSHNKWNFRYTYMYTAGKGLQCFKLNGNQTENDRYLEKNNFLLFAKCLKMYSFFRICILRLQKVLLWPKIYFSWKISIWVSKTRRILCWFQIHWCRLSEMPLTKVKSKKPRKNAQKRKNSKFA